MSANPDHTTNPIAALLLAAGSSRRFGPDNKLLALLDGKPVVRRTAEALAASRVSRIVVVTGADANLVATALDGLGAGFVHNPVHDQGMGASLAAGIASLDREAAGVLVCLGDMPLVSSALIDTLIHAFRSTGCARIVLPTSTDGRAGHPVLWPRPCFSDLAALSGDRGGKHLLARHAALVERVAVTGENAFADIDTPADLRRHRSGLRN